MGLPRTTLYLGEHTTKERWYQKVTHTITIGEYQRASTRRHPSGAGSDASRRSSLAVRAEAWAVAPGQSSTSHPCSRARYSGRSRTPSGRWTPPSRPASASPTPGRPCDPSGCPRSLSRASPARWRRGSTPPAGRLRGSPLSGRSRGSRPSLRWAASEARFPSISCEGLIAYNSTELSNMAYRARIKSGFGVFGNRNVAVARVPGWNGWRAGDLVIGFSKGGGFHAEDDILTQLAAKDVSPKQINALYTERQPCPVCGPIWRTYLQGGHGDHVVRTVGIERIDEQGVRKNSGRYDPGPGAPLGPDLGRLAP